MPSLRVLIEQGEVCCCLRTKSMFYEVEGDALQELEGPFWCGQTQSLIGPDGEIAEPGRCRPGRECCQLS